MIAHNLSNKNSRLISPNETLSIRSKISYKDRSKRARSGILLTIATSSMVSARWTALEETAA
ncbi:hypothetical protein D3C86_2031230 [compost metagenome]